MYNLAEHTRRILATYSAVVCIKCDVTHQIRVEVAPRAHEVHGHVDVCRGAELAQAARGTVLGLEADEQLAHGAPADGTLAEVVHPEPIRHCGGNLTPAVMIDFLNFTFNAV